MIKKSSGKKDNTLIDDSGIIRDSNARRATVFVILCRIVSALLIILGIVTIINP